MDLSLTFSPINFKFFRIFGHTDNSSDIIYTNWLSLFHDAVKGLEMYSPAANEWKQAHCQAFFVIVQVRNKKTPFWTFKIAKYLIQKLRKLNLKFDRKNLFSFSFY